MSPDETIRKAIDEAIAPLVSDHFAHLGYAPHNPMTVARADLLYVFDKYHRQLLDFSAAMMPVGHNHPNVVNAIKEHTEYYLRTAPFGEHVLRWPVEYAAKVSASFVDSDEDDVVGPRVVFTEGEREAVLTAINLARQFSHRTRIAMVDTDVHNWVSEVNHTDIALIPIEEFFLDEFRWGDKGALLLSLVTADGRVLDARWVQKVVDAAMQNGVPVIVDESLTGFGRTGTMWAQTNASIEADITVLGGPVGGGLALGAVVAPTRFFLAFSGSFSSQAGSPIACAAGAATLGAINAGVLEHVKEAGATFHDGLTTLVNQFPEYLVATHGVGLWRTLEFQDGYTWQFYLDAMAKGLLVPRPSSDDTSITLTPPLITSEMELSRGVDMISEVLLDWADQSR